jgi:cation diffusion facilitator CzcD-associated flavoprotein CzcO
MNVAVIGAGPSGLVTIKELLEEGHDVVCFEKADEIGGLFRFDPNGVGVYESTRMTSSVFISCFSDFPYPENAPFHFKHDEYLAYLKNYTEVSLVLFKLGFERFRPHLRLAR